MYVKTFKKRLNTSTYMYSVGNVILENMHMYMCTKGDILMCVIFPDRQPNIRTYKHSVGGNILKNVHTYVCSKVMFC